MYTFENERYVTRGVNAEIPLGVQLALWKAIDELRNTEKVLDYLQVFKIEVLDNVVPLVKITHSQEVPEYKKEYVTENVGLKRDVKVYVIDDTTHSTMLLAEEY